MFPPPQPWKQIGTVDPQCDYVAFTSRFHLRSLLRVPSFLRQSYRIMRQANTSPGIVGWSLGSDLLRLQFYTLSAWEDSASLQAFIKSGGHGVAIQKFEKDMRRPSIFVHYRVPGKDLPLSWDDAMRRQEARSRPAQ